MKVMKYPIKLLLLFFQFTFLAIHSQANDQNSTTDDPYKMLHIIPNPDGSITRMKRYYPTVPPNGSTSLAFSKDVPLNTGKNTWVRLYLPINISQPVSRPVTKNLPIVVFSHGGGFIIMSTASPTFDSFLSNTASKLHALVVSIEYRLAPEHRLPAAYDDVLEGLHWVKEKKDDWVKNYANVSNCIVMGESAGGNIAYHVGLRASVLVHELNPLVIKGLVLIQPFFGGLNRTRSELRKPASFGLPVVITDLMWNLSLPIGANRNHPYCDPIIEGGSNKMLDKIKELGWRVAIAGYDRDRLFDKQLEVFEFLKQRGVDVVGNFSKGGYHGVFVKEANISEKLFEFMRRVFSSNLA
ncbi:carboxylesterase 1-like [Spinacia oleracea]|uniref:Carboxylesterase 1-like n=1 Tax=Spinacia oleracea TaxID=3562 RepID=A0A9R0JE39_SPIOL|nr:carboxylesterase 1-like [Spinacia oleracea]